MSKGAIRTNRQFFKFTRQSGGSSALKCLLTVQSPDTALTSRPPPPPLPLSLPPSLPPTAACTPPLTPTELASHSCYHAQQCLTKTLACTSQPRPQ